MVEIDDYIYVLGVEVSGSADRKLSVSNSVRRGTEKPDFAEILKSIA